MKPGSSNKANIKSKRSTEMRKSSLNKPNKPLLKRTKACTNILRDHFKIFDMTILKSEDNVHQKTILSNVKQEPEISIDYEDSINISGITKLRKSHAGNADKENLKPEVENAGADQPLISIKQELLEPEDNCSIETIPEMITSQRDDCVIQNDIDASQVEVISSVIDQKSEVDVQSRIQFSKIQQEMSLEESVDDYVRILRKRKNSSRKTTVESRQNYTDDEESSDDEFLPVKRAKKDKSIILKERYASYCKKLNDKILRISQMNK